MDELSNKLKPLISIVICIFNKEKYIYDLLINLWKSSQSYRNFELIIVFDGCVDKSEKEVNKALKHFAAINVKKFYTKNIFEVRSNNKGLINCEGKYCVIVQDDNFVNEKNWLEKITSFFENNKNVGVIGLLAGVNFHKLNSKISGKNVYTSKTEIFNRITSKELKRKNKDYLEVDAVMRGPIVLVRKLLIKHGYFDEIYAPLYNDDMDYCFRIRELGMKVVFMPLNVENKNLTLQDYSIFNNPTWNYFWTKNKKTFYKRWEYLMRL